MITCPPNELMATFHHRMPVLLDGDALLRWLDPTLRDVSEVLSLLTPAPDDYLTTRAVSDLVNNVRNDGPHLIEPVDP